MMNEYKMKPDEESDESSLWGHLMMQLRSSSSTDFLPIVLANEQTEKKASVTAASAVYDF